MSPYGKGVTSWWPTRKWWAATVVGAGTVATDWAVTGHWSQALTIAAVGLGVQRATSYLVPNESAPSRERVRAAVVEGSRPSTESVRKASRKRRVDR